uniref:Snake toxin/toxin-like domain-containing protein n=1 Tax=Panagrolaimus sp. JU765 TaxID=591449 RepID=A0AC34QPK3_9BILA
MWCTNETLLKIPKKEVIKPCAPWEHWCTTAITTSLNSFTSVSRSCAVRCPINCESVGYGQNQVTCADCCKNNTCNDQFSVDYYKTVMARQYTGWSQPGASEKEFNRKSNIRFPY